MLNQIASAIVLSFAFLFVQITRQPYLNSYHNFMSAFVNMQIVVTLFASLLFKIDNEMEDSLSYEAGYNLATVALVLIIFTSTVGLEILRYIKTAVEFMSSVVVVEASLAEEVQPIASSEAKVGSLCNWTPFLIWLKGDLEEGECESECEHSEAKARLEEAIQIGHDFIDSLSNELFRGKVSKRTKDRVTKKIENATELLESNATTSKLQLDEKREDIRRALMPAMAKASPAGLYFALAPDFSAFPRQGIFQQAENLMGEKCSRNFSSGGTRLFMQTTPLDG